MTRLPMRKIREVLRLAAQGLATREMAASLSIGRTTLREYISRARSAGLSWPLPGDLSDGDLERMLFPRETGDVQKSYPQPDWAHIHAELRRKSVTLSLLWEEYRAVHPDGYGYSRFCELYRRWEGRLTPTMRQHHIAGERAFVDFAGDTIEVICAETGEVRQAQLFVGVLGASSYTYAEAVWTQTLSDWIGAHVRMLGFFGGVPEQLVSDNLRAGITKACFYEPKVNRTYADFAAHYDTAVIPARPYKPRDKAKAEVGVQLVQRWIAAALRNRRFRSLNGTECGDPQPAGAIQLARSPGTSAPAAGTCSRRSTDRRFGRCPPRPTSMPNGSSARSGSITTSRSNALLLGPASAPAPEGLGQDGGPDRGDIPSGQRVASHVRTSGNRKHTTVAAHMPASHRRYAGWTPAEIKRRAEQIGPNTGALVDLILRTKTHPEQGFRACLGIVRLAKPHGRETLEAACERAIEIGGTSYSSVNSILKNNLHRRRPDKRPDGPAITHPNIRGADYFH